MSNATEYRAAYWISDNRQGEIRLTGPEHADLPEKELVAEAKAEADYANLDLSGGEIVVGMWRER